MKMLPYFPVYVDDFEAATVHLTFAEEGVLNRLQRLTWRQDGCSLPDDKDWIYRHVRATTEDDRELVNRVVDEFFKRKGKRLFNPRLTEEFEKAKAAYLARAAAGKKGGAAKALKEKEFSSSRAKAEPKQSLGNQTQNQNESHNSKEAPGGARVISLTGKTEEMSPEAIRRELLSILGVDTTNAPRYWQAPSANAHIKGWIDTLKVTPSQILAAAQESRAQHPLPPDGPKALDKRLNRIAIGGSTAHPQPQEARGQTVRVHRTFARLPGEFGNE